MGALNLAGIMTDVMTVDVDAVGGSARSGGVSTEAVSTMCVLSVWMDAVVD